MRTCVGARIAVVLAHGLRRAESVAKTSKNRGFPVIRMTGKNGLLAFVVLLVGCIELTSCQTTPKPVVIREPVVVPQLQYVEIDKKLTAPCAIAEPRNRSGKELLRVARERKTALIVCANADKAAIGQVQGTVVP